MDAVRHLKYKRVCSFHIHHVRSNLILLESFTLGNTEIGSMGDMHCPTIKQLFFPS